MTMINTNGGINMVAKILRAIVRVSIAVMKYHDQNKNQIGKESFYFSLLFVIY